MMSRMSVLAAVLAVPMVAAADDTNRTNQPMNQPMNQPQAQPMNQPQAQPMNQGSSQGMNQPQPRSSGDDAAMIPVPPGAKLLGTAVVDEIRAFPEMGKGKAKAAEHIVTVAGVDKVYQIDRPFADVVSYFDQQFKKTNYQVMARVDSPTATAWTVKRPDGTIANAVVRNTSPATFEIAEAAAAAAKVEVK